MAKILTCYYRPKPGGFCKRLFMAIRAILEKGHTVHYLAVLPFPIDHPECHFHRFPWPENKTKGFLFWTVFHFLSVFFLIRMGFRYKITALFAFGHSYGLIMQPLKIIKKIPLNLFLRADIIATHKINGSPGWLVFIDYILEGMAIYKTDLICVSKSLKNNVKDRHKIFSPLKSWVLPNNLPELPIIIRRKYNRPVKMGCVGILNNGKNQKMLINIMKNISSQKANLYLYGIGPDEKYLREMARQSRVKDRVFFMGWIESEKIWPQIDILLCPTLHEGSPNVVMEAMAQGVPILASDIPEHREILPGDSLLPHKEESWIRKINSICKNPESELLSIGEKQFYHALKLNFDWDDLFCKHLNCEK